MSVKLNNANDYDAIDPIPLRTFKKAFWEKVEELIDECGMSREEAIKTANGIVIELEVYYEKGQGLFAIESEAVESSCDIYSPYTGELCEPADEDN